MDLNCRYLKKIFLSTWRLWHLSEFWMHEQSHTIYKLASTCQTNKGCIFVRVKKERRPGKNPETSTWQPGLSWTTKIQLPAAYQFLHIEIPEDYVFNDKGKKWTEREWGRSSVIISRMYSASPADQEKFYLRILLLHRPGATSHTD